MRLKIVTPNRITLDEPVNRIVAEGPDGAFGMLPRHVDFVTQLVAGIIVYEDRQGGEHYAGVNSGTLVKCGDEVLVSTRSAVLSDDLERLRRRVTAQFRQLDETERAARAALARLEAQMVRRFRELDQPA